MILSHYGLLQRGDPDWARVLLLSGFDGADASTTIVDRGPNSRTLTAVGNAQLDTAQAKYGPSSLLLDGTGDDVQCADNAVWTFNGATPWCVESFVRFTALTNGAGGADIDLISHYSSSSNQRGWCFGTTSTGTAMRFFSSSAGTAGSLTVHLTPAFAFATNTWYHVACSYDGNVVRIFVDGALIGSATVGTLAIHDSTAALTLGSSLSATPVNNALNGWMDEVRITYGAARYTAAFTPPGQAFPRW